MSTRAEAADRVPPPRVRGGDVLYLDFDGVLHHEQVLVDASRQLYFGPAAHEGGRAPRLFEHAELLIELLAPYADVRIVLSTSWARRSFHFARAYLPQALANRCVGATYHGAMERRVFDAHSRGMQVWLDAQRREPRAWLALDDDDRDWPGCCRDRLVLVRNDLAAMRDHVAARFGEAFGAAASRSSARPAASAG